MRNIKYLILATLAFFFMTDIVSAADSTNCSSINYIEGNTWVVYYGTMTFGEDDATDSTDNSWSQAMYIGECNEDYGGIQIYATNGAGTEDANGILCYSNDPDVDLTYFDAGTTYGELDQIQTTVKWDTLGYDTGLNDKFKYSNWLVIKLDGQAGNPAGSVYNFFVYLQKKKGVSKTGVARIKSTT